VDAEAILQFLRANQNEITERFFVGRIGLFGSTRHAANREDSDIDILVEMGQPTFDHYMDLKFYLEAHLGRSVDLVLADTVKPRLRSRIADEVVYA
jgi:predicted nucleotidyltransferase